MIMDEALKKEVEAIAEMTFNKLNKSGAFTNRKITDTPTEPFAVVNRRFVTLNGVVANRPVASVAVVGQHYFATDTNIPMIYSAAGWRNGVGSIVAQNN